MANKRSSKGNVITVDFTGVEAGGGGKLLPEGPHLFEVEDVEVTKSSNDNPMLKMTFSVAEGNFEGTKAWDNFTLVPQSLWKLRSFLDACGIETVDSTMDLDVDDMIGRVFVGDIIHEEYKGKTKHRLSAFSPAEDTPVVDAPRAATKKKAAAPEPEVEEAPWKVKQKVAFRDGKKRYTGVITEISDDTATVKVGDDEYEVSLEELEAA